MGHALGNAVSGNIMMRLWPAILRAGGFLNHMPTKDFWAELTEICSQWGMARPSGLGNTVAVGLGPRAPKHREKKKHASDRRH